MGGMISAVVVSYRSGHLARRAIAALREDAARGGLGLEAVAVVNSGDADEVRAVESVADVTIDPGANLGYAGGLNHGIAAARGDVLLLMNPDVTVRPGAVATLVAAVRSTPLTMAGPATYLDEEESVLIPIFDEPTPLDLARRRLLLDPRGADRVFARRLPRVLRAVESVSRRETFTVSALSGGMMAVERATLERVGGFDERYRLYFEENDWQRRLRLSGGRLLLVGAARALHPYGRTTRGDPRADRWFAESERRYFTEHFPARGAAALDALTRSASNLRPWPKLPVSETLSWEGAAVGVAVSPLRTFGVFAWAGVSRAARDWHPPAGFREMLEGATWYARAVEGGTGATLAEVTLRA
jgi:N-acetylglucosaminyl-diphospho-decaprenol L-rhamnosyltransferase